MGFHISYSPLYKPFMLLLSAALCSSTVFVSHQSDFSARVLFCSSLQHSLYTAEVDLVILVWWAWFLLLIRVCSSWLLGSIQSWYFLSGLPKYVLAVSYTTCCSAAHSSSGSELSLSSHWARAQSFSCSKLFLWLMISSFAVLSVVGFLVPYLLCFCRILKVTFDLSIWRSVQLLAPRMARVRWMSILSRHLVMMKSIICQCLERYCIQVVLRSSFCLNMMFVTISSNSEQRASRSSPLELHFPIPCLPMTKGHLSLSLPILALKYPISSSLSVRGIPLSTHASWL